MDKTSPNTSDNHNVIECIQSNDEKTVQIQTYKYRWTILMLYGVTIASTGNITCCLYNITDLVCEYYGISESSLFLASTIGNAITVATLIPATFLPSRYGLRTAVMVGSGLLAVGAAFFVPASTKNGYVWFIVSQTCFGTATGILFQLAPDISAVWFPTNQHTLATSINFQMQSIGVGISYLLTMFLFNNAKTLSKFTIQNRLKILMYTESTLCMLVFFFNLFFFKNLPKLPPSMSQAKRSGPGNIPFWESIQSLKIICRNWKFGVLALAFAFNFAFGYAYPLINNSLITPNYANGEWLVSICGILVVLCSAIGTLLFSMLLDKTHQYKMQLVVQLVVSLVLMVVFSVLLIHRYSFYIVCATVVVCWFFFFSTQSIIVEIIAEVTYPVNNSTALVLCVVIGLLLGTALTQLSGWFADRNQTDVICWILIGSIAVQILLVLGVKIDKKRSLMDSDSNDSNLVSA